MDYTDSPQGQYDLGRDEWEEHYMTTDTNRLDDIEAFLEESRKASLQSAATHAADGLFRIAYECQLAALEIEKIQQRVKRIRQS